MIDHPLTQYPVDHRMNKIVRHILAHPERWWLDFFDESQTRRDDGTIKRRPFFQYGGDHPVRYSLTRRQFDEIRDFFNWIGARRAAA